MLTKESTAWLALAEALDDFGPDYLCAAIEGWCYDPPRWTETFSLRITTEVRRRMLQRIHADLCAFYGQDDLDPTLASYGYPWDSENHEGRVLVCLMFAHEAASEGR